MKRPIIYLAVLSLLAGACSSSDDDSSSGATSSPDTSTNASAAGSPFSPEPPAGADTIPTEPGNYNYSPAVLDEGDVIKAWWCSAEPDAATDNIWYQEYDKRTKQYSGRRSVLKTGKTGDWDTFGVCHPTVIRGEWPGAPGGGTFTYAMYYTSTNDAAGGGENNSTGVIFSTDGINWSGQHDARNPIIKQKVPKVKGTYGAGLPSAWSRGGSKVTLFWIDTTSEKVNDPLSPDGYASRILVADSDDGIHFERSRLVTKEGAPAYWKNDFAFDDSVKPAMVYSAQAISFRRGPEKNETYNFGFYRIPMDDLLSGGGRWEELGVVDTNLTGFPLNFEPGLVRTGTGKVATDVGKDGLEVWFGGGGQTPDSWGLRRVIFKTGGGRMTLRRYTKSSGGPSWVTSGYVPEAFRSGNVEELGQLDSKPSAGMVPLYGCQETTLNVTREGELTDAGAARYVSVEGCPVHTLGINGYLFRQPPSGVKTKALYACKEGAAQFVSNDAKCGGKIVEKLLGHARAG